VKKNRWPGWDLTGQEANVTPNWSKATLGENLSLTQAIRRVSRTNFPLREAYRVEIYRDADLNVRMPVLAAAISADKLFPIFLDLLPPLGKVVDFIVESSHEVTPERDGASPVPLTWERESIDLPVLTSVLYDYEDLLLNDGCSGVAVLNPDRELEVHFDEHKLLYIYGPNLSAFESILRRYRVPRNNDLILVTEEEHIHCTLDEYFDQLNELRQIIGVEGEVESTSW
jgi:hypothetical protein